MVCLRMPPFLQTLLYLAMLAPWVTTPNLRAFDIMQILKIPKCVPLASNTSLNLDSCSNCQHVIYTWRSNWCLKLICPYPVLLALSIPHSSKRHHPSILMGIRAYDLVVEKTWKAASEDPPPFYDLLWRYIKLIFIWSFLVKPKVTEKPTAEEYMNSLLK